MMNTNFELSDFLDVDEWFEDHPASMASGSSQNPISLAMNIDIDRSGMGIIHGVETSSNKRNGSEKNKKEKDDTAKVAFRTKSDLEILDDGFKWRKYGKKMVKNSPNPRNYYRCSVDGCPVKKRVERDGEDPSYVITTYQGVHNHESPSL